MERQDLLRKIPKVDELLGLPPLASLAEELPAGMARDAVREVLEELRQQALSGGLEALHLPPNGPGGRPCPPCVRPSTAPA